jgi:hypothetical protein
MKLLFLLTVILAHNIEVTFGQSINQVFLHFLPTNTNYSFRWDSNLYRDIKDIIIKYF